MKSPLRMPSARGPIGLLLLCLLAACQDTAPTGPAVGPQFDISEARFGDGNPDFFFYAPLAADPSPTDPTFEPGASNGALTPYLRVCETDGAENAGGCTADVTEAVTGSSAGLAMTYQATDELYQVNFRTGELDPTKDYRIEIWAVGFNTTDRTAIAGITFPSGHTLEGRPRWLFGWRDISDSPSTAACTGLEEFCFINFGQNVPVKVRVEDSAFCPVSRNCATQFVASGTDANLEALFGPGAAATSAQLYIPGQEGTDFALSFEPCSAEDEAKVRGYAQFPVFGPCVKTIVPPIYDETIVLSSPLTVSYCEEIDHEAIEAQLAYPATQIERVNVHHFSTAGDPNGPIQKAQALPEVFPMCDDPTAGGLASVESERSLIRLAADAGQRLRSLFRAKPLLALDRGGGGESEQPESFFMFGMSGKFEYEFEGDDFRTAPVDSDVTLRVKVTDSDGNPVMGARPDWSVASAPDVDASVDEPVSGWPLTLSDGISQATVTLSATEGNNVFHAGGIGLADPREDECTVPGGVAGDALCNGPIVEEYDPFRPITAASLGGVIDIPDDTFLPFTVFGCWPGYGTPNIDGTLASGEWDCANTRTFDVNLSGGSTVEATLYWMNDATDFHIAVSVPGTDRRNALRVEWNNGGDGDAVAEGEVYATARTPGDDVWEFDPRSGTADKFVDEGCSGSGQSGCGEDDDAFGGLMETTAAFNNSAGGVTVYEMSHPLSSGDTCDRGGRQGCGDLQGDAIDIGLGAGYDAGFFVTLSLGNGAQGDTQDPGFLQYLKVVIR